MKTVQQTIITAIISLGLFVSLPASAKVWRLNNNTGISADFSSLQTAINSAAVQNGDTIYVEPSSTIYGFAQLSKRLVFIGAGYLLSGTGGNPGLQANPNSSAMGSFVIDSLASGSSFYGLSFSPFLNNNVDNLTFSRCNITMNQNTAIANATGISNIVINKCRASINMTSYRFINPSITNNILSLTSIDNVENGLFRNNTIISTNVSLSNFYVSNNIFSSSSMTFTTCSVKYNVSTTNNLPDPVANNNKVNVPAASLFIGGNSTDGQYQLAAASPALGAGEPIGGITPDAGAFGTADPYRLSGIPAIPTIYTLTVPSSVPAAATTMTITFSTRSNN